MAQNRAPILVFTSVFPNAAQPNLGLFVRERMFRVHERIPIVVVAPVAWFPFQAILRRWRPHFRPLPLRREIQNGVEVWHPRFFSVPGLLKGMDGLSMALASRRIVRRLKAERDLRLIDAHFAYPDGYAATLLGQNLRLPVTITLRGTEVSLSRYPARRRRILRAIAAANRVFSVSDSLRQHVVSLGADLKKIRVVGNGVTLTRFRRESRKDARARLGIPQEAQVIIGVGALCERKGFHRVLDLIPRLIDGNRHLIYLVVGGPTPEGDWTDKLRQQVTKLGVENAVRFTGPVAPDELRWYLSASDLFVLATSNEGWANVFLEAMACGLPVITTDVGGNREVVARPELGIVVRFGEREALYGAIESGLAREWDRAEIQAWASENTWDRRVDVLVEEFERLIAKKNRTMARTI